MHESDALHQYAQQVNCEISQCGLFIDPTGMLGASPDGIINENELIEVKCPYSAKSTSLMDLAMTKKDFFLKIAGDHLVLDKNHEYYDQVQGGLHLANAELCHFVVWTPTELLVERIPKESDWENNLILLRDFYKNTFLPLLLSLEL